MGAGFRLGGTLFGKTPSMVLVRADDLPQIWEIGGGVELGWSPDIPVGPVLGLGVSLLSRTHRVDTEVLGRRLMPRVTTDLGLSIKLGPVLRLEPRAQVRFDLLASNPFVARRTGERVIAPVGFSAGAGLTIVPAK